MELRDYLNVIRARRGIIILATLIVTAVALATSLVQPPVYRSEAKVLVSEKDSASALLGTVLPELSSQPERALQTQVQLVQVRPIAEATIKELGLEMTPEALLQQVEVSAVGQTNILAIAAKARTAELAASIANSMADQYARASIERQRKSITQAADEVEQRLEQARSEILEIGRRLQSSGTSDELTAELQIATGTYSTLAEKLEQLRINEQLENGSGVVVQDAVALGNPVEPRPLRNVALGLVVGLVFGLGMAFLYEYLDNTIKSTEEAEKIYGAPVLGSIPLDRIEKGQERRLVILDAPGSSTAEAYRVLRNSLDFINFEHELKTLLVTSAAPAEGKSTVAANLAMALSQSGKKVVLVSADFRRPTTDQFLPVNNLVGLSDVLAGTHSLKAALQRPSGDQLLVLAAGKMPPNPSELLGSRKMQEVVAALQEWGDWVIIDAPPLLAVSDPAASARWVDGVLMVSKAGESTRDSGRKAVELLGKVGARVLGVVIWGIEEGKGRYGDYAGGYYYYRSYYGRSSGGSGGVEGRPKTDAKGDDAWVPEVSGGRRVARAVGRILTGVLAFLAVLAVVAVAAYFLDQYFGWGLGAYVSGWLPG